MPTSTADSPVTAQGFGESTADRLPMPAMDQLDEQQQAAARALIEGPRKGVFGPFVSLLKAPDLLDRVAKLGEYLRFNSGLDARIRNHLGPLHVFAGNMPAQFLGRAHHNLRHLLGESVHNILRGHRLVYLLI